MKLVPRCSGVIEGNVVRDNRGPGIWLDTDYDAADPSKHLTIRDNDVVGNHEFGHEPWPSPEIPLWGERFMSGACAPLDRCTSTQNLSRGAQAFFLVLVSP